MNGVYRFIGTAAPAIAMIAVLALVIGGVKLVRRGGETRTKGWLMIVCAVVVLGNVLIWTV